MNISDMLFGQDRRVIVYTSSNGMMGKAICKERDVARHISDMIKVSGSVSVRIEPFIA